jgi:hypothetical protein
VIKSLRASRSAICSRRSQRERLRAAGRLSRSKFNEARRSGALRAQFGGARVRAESLRWTWCTTKHSIA